MSFHKTVAPWHHKWHSISTQCTMLCSAHRRHRHIHTFECWNFGSIFDSIYHSLQASSAHYVGIISIHYNLFDVNTLWRNTSITCSLDFCLFIFKRTCETCNKGKDTNFSITWRLLIWFYGFCDFQPSKLYVRRLEVHDQLVRWLVVKEVCLLVLSFLFCSFCTANNSVVNFPVKCHPKKFKAY